MGKPTESELEIALAKAAEMRESGQDGQFVAKSLLNLNYRMGFYDELLEKAKLYLHSGEGAHEHSMLLKAIEKVEEASLAPGEEDTSAHPW